MRLHNTRYKLETNGALTVAYFGGSITEGGGDDGWRALMTRDLKTRFPKADIREVNAAIGGTGTELGVFRCDEDVLAHKPDLIFVEFALNDGFACDEARVRANVESIVRKLLIADAYTDIVFAFTTSKDTEDYLAAGNTHLGRRAHDAVRAHYGLCDVLDIAAPLARAVRAAGGDWLACTGDTVHPNKAGYAVMAEAAAKQMDELLNVEPALSAYALPAPLCDSLRVGARLTDAWPLVERNAQPDTAVVCDWSRLYLSLCRRYPRVIGANKPGAILTFAFSGASVGMYAMIASDSGDLAYRVDGGAWREISTWDHYALNFARAAFMPLASGLSAGAHTLEMRVSEHKNERSTGHWVRIGAFGVEE